VHRLHNLCHVPAVTHNRSIIFVCRYKTVAPLPGVRCPRCQLTHVSPDAHCCESQALNCFVPAVGLLAWVPLLLEGLLQVAGAWDLGRHLVSQAGVLAGVPPQVVLAEPPLQ